MNLKDVPREGWLALATCGIWFGVGLACAAMALAGSTPNQNEPTTRDESCIGSLPAHPHGQSR